MNKPNTRKFGLVVKLWKMGARALLLSFLE